MPGLPVPRHCPQSSICSSAPSTAASPTPDRPWIRVEESGAVWLDDQFLAASLGALSGGERRVLTVVTALADSTNARHINLTDTVTGLDRTNLDLVLAALAHAAGSHDHAALAVADDGHSARFVRQPALHPWPATASQTAGAAAASPPAASPVGPSPALGL